MNAVVNSAKGLLKGLVLVALLALAGNALAATKASMDLLHPASISGTQLPAGNYTLQWDGQGDQVQVQILQGKKTVAKVSAHVVKVDHPVRDNSVMVTPNSDGSQTVMRINFSKKDFALEPDSEGGSGSGAAGASK